MRLVVPFDPVDKRQSLLSTGFLLHVDVHTNAHGTPLKNLRRKLCFHHLSYSKDCKTLKEFLMNQEAAQKEQKLP